MTIVAKLHLSQSINVVVLRCRAFLKYFLCVSWLLGVTNFRSLFLVGHVYLFRESNKIIKVDTGHMRKLL